MIKIIGLLLLIPFFLPTVIEARNGNQGCCSHHGGVSGCRGGSIVCGDGSYSPTCGCSSTYAAPTSTSRPIVTYTPIPTRTPFITPTPVFVPYLLPSPVPVTKSDDGTGAIASLAIIGALGYWGFRKGKSVKK